MPEVDITSDGAVNDGAKVNLNEPNTTTVHLDLDESKAHLINANGGATGDHEDEQKTQIIDPSASSSGDLPFSGLRKEDVMQYANDPFWVRLRWILFILFWVGWLAMLVTAIVIIVLAPRCPPRPDLKWYQTETVYQVIPESFKDSDGDGVGDFQGLTEKLSYISSDLGIKAIWISSIFETDEKSNLGVLDHKAIKKSFGVSLEQFTGWLKKLRKEGLKVILDLIPNQTSKNHTWFNKSKEGDEHYKDYYIWGNGTNGEPPSDWKAYTWKSPGGIPTWSFDSVRNSYYFSQFDDYPDLNLTNEFVKEEIKNIMKFWIDAGVSGFNIEGVEYLVEDFSMPIADLLPNPLLNYAGSLAFLEELRTVADAYSDKPGREKVLFATVEHASENQTLEFWGTSEKKRLHIVTPLLNLDKHDGAKSMKTMIDLRLTDDGYQWLGIQLGNQRTPRIATRLDDADGNYKLRLIVAHALQLLLPGTPFNYYGDEFGQRNGKTSTANTVTIAGTVHHLDDYCTPMQWDTQENAGFTSKNVTPWLPVGPNYKIDNVQASLAHFSDVTPFKSFKLLLKLRSRESFQWGKTQVCSPNEDLLILTRKAYRFPYFLILINTNSRETLHVSPEELTCVTSKDTGKIVFHSKDKQVGESLDLKGRGIQLEKFDVVVIEFAADEE